jgi:hypothetical protein
MKRWMALMITLLLLGMSYASAVPLLDGSSNFLTQAAGTKKTYRTDEASLTILALSSALPYLSNKSGALSTIKSYSEFLVEIQNRDGGWGYQRGDVSSVISTSYAVIGLAAAIDKAPQAFTEPEISIVKASAYSGTVFLRNAFNGEAWGFIPDSPSEVYPTAMALWALGERGYSYKDHEVAKAIEYLESVDAKTPAEIALTLIAYSSVGYTSPKTDEMLDTLKNLVLNEKLKTKDAALAVCISNFYILLFCKRLRDFRVFIFFSYIDFTFFIFY